MKQCSVIGVGLIGGSIALNIKALFPEVVIYGVDTNHAHVEEAMAMGWIDAAGSNESVINSELIVVAVPVDASSRVILRILDQIGEGTLVIDVGSTKSPICTALATHPKRHQFLATHPIAGTEFSGPRAAFQALFVGKTNIICEVEKTSFKLQEMMIEVFVNMGMRIRYMDPVAHDKHIAYVSHLSHISSFMLGKTVIEKEKNERDIFDLAGSGFASTVRLAKSSPAMWTPIFIQNKEAILESLQDYIVNLENFKTLIESGNQEEIYNDMEQTNRLKQILTGIK